ncbi:MAG TPA: ABC transporter ATP-binding protein [bacterium (Candidatus Stahlbacteria)]|nr:ABC transporter ATP-binding protein [Candidatus Stahlbacteria bacterium]
MLELIDVTVGYDTLPVIKELSFSINEGDFLVIIGPNGAGKSTLLRAMCGILKPWKGDILFHGKNLSSYNRRTLAKFIGVVPQRSELTFPFGIEEVVMMGRFAHSSWFEKKEDYEITRWAMEKTDTYYLKDRRIDEISGGEFQRVIIARALAQKPSLLLLDEPTAHLDINHELEIFDLIKSLNREGLTLCVTSHDLNIAGTYAEKILLLSDGKIVKIGNPKEILTKELIEKVYHSQVIVEKNPATGTPLIIPVPKDVHPKQ